MPSQKKAIEDEAGARAAPGQGEESGNPEEGREDDDEGGLETPRDGI